MTRYIEAQKELLANKHTGLVFTITKELRGGSNIFIDLLLKLAAMHQLEATDKTGLEYVHFGSATLTRETLIGLFYLDGLEIRGIKAYVELDKEVGLASGLIESISHPNKELNKATYALHKNNVRLSYAKFLEFITAYGINEIVFLNEYKDFLETNIYNAIEE